MPDTTDTDVARMPEIANATLAETFHWPETVEERLYRECPTAFWLAPGGEEPAYTAKPSAPDTPPDAAIDPASATGQFGAIGLAMLVAGPVFLSTLGLVMPGDGTAIEGIAKGVVLGLVSAPLSIPIGGIAAMMPVAIGVTLLAWLGTVSPAARYRSVWAATGGGMGLLIGALFDAGMTTIPLVLTSIACAAVARKAIGWVDPEPA